MWGALADFFVRLGAGIASAIRGDVKKKQREDQERIAKIIADDEAHERTHTGGPN